LFAEPGESGVLDAAALKVESLREQLMPKVMKEPRILDLTKDDFSKEVVPGVAYMKHMFANDLSVALFKIPAGKGSQFPKHVHKHGEEVGIQLKGSSRLFACGKEYVIREGQAIVVPGGLEHAGIFGDEESWLLAIATPPREDYGPEDW
jgi:quercetin dioxygenase-like cupin family protein